MDRPQLPEYRELVIQEGQARAVQERELGNHIRSCPVRLPEWDRRISRKRLEVYHWKPTEKEKKSA